jgi:hypothetical protein
MVMSKVTPLTYGYKLQLNSFELLGISKRHRVPHSEGILKFGSNYC